MLTSFAIAFLTTIFLLQWWIRPSYPLSLWLLLGCVGFLGCVGCLSKRKRISALLLSCVLGISLALWNVARTERRLAALRENLPFTTPLHVEGMVTGLPEWRQEHVVYTVTLPTQGKIAVRTRETQSRFIHGDMVRIDGSIERIQPPYERYFRAQGILGSVSYPAITATGARSGSILLRALARGNSAFSARIRDLVPEPEASLLAGLLLGETGGFPQETLAAFRTAGLTHILAVSGYNITLLLIALSALTARLPGVARLAAATGGIALFTFFIGGSPSAIRAAIMGSLGLLALHARRLPDTRRTILWAAFLMLLWNPMQLWWDASFQLSFLAVIGITELQPAIKKFLRRVPDSFGIQETLTVTLAAQCTALPWAASLFGSVPLWSPLANLLVAPAIPFAMLAGPVALLGGVLHDVAGRLLAFPCWIALRWITFVAETIAALPFASIPFPSQAFPLLLLYYAVLVVLLVLPFIPNIRGNFRPRASRAPQYPG